MEQNYYAAYHLDEKVCNRSSSGGAFTAITDAWFDFYKENAVVYGCVLDSGFFARHERATTKAGRDRMCGSKYIGSDMSGISAQVGKDLFSGKYVCFSGTPCQINGLKSYLKAVNAPTDARLLTIDVVCHGVGSTRFFKEYLFYLERKYKSKAVYCNFRSKSRPGKKQDMSVHFENGRRYSANSTKFDWFYSVYLRNYIMRPSCYECKFASVERVADITIADMWSVLPADRKASSLIMVNTDLGNNWFSHISSSMKIWMVNKEILDQPHLHTACSMPENYSKFWQVFDEKGYESVQRWIGNNTCSGKFKSGLATTVEMLHLRKVAKWILERIKDG